MNKQIEEMANDLRKSEHWFFDDHDCDFELDRKKTAENLYNAGYRKQEWISVEERLPTEEEYRDEYCELIPLLVVEKGTTYPYRAMYDGSEWGDGLMKIRGITHWMPLPEAPKGDDGE